MKKTMKNIVLYLLLIVGLWAFCFVTLKYLLMPYSVAYTQSGKMTVGYFCYAAIGLIFSTPAPFISVLIIALFKERIGLKKLFQWIFRTENKRKTILLTGGFCLFALLFALINGNAQRLLLGHAPARIPDYDTVCRDRRGNRVARAFAACI